MKKTYFLLTLLMIAFVLSCKNDEKKIELPFINPPLPTLNPQTVSFSFDAEKGDTLTYRTGSIISIPPNIWVDSVGKKINGTIKITYREFHNAYDIFLAGVTMAYDTAGFRQNIKTAGMFEIRAFNDTTEIFIKEGTTINVKLASFNEQKGYNFYSLDEKNKYWKYKGTAEPEPNKNIQLIQDSIKKLKLKEIFKQRPKDWLAKYDILEKKIEKAKAWLATQAPVFRSFDIDKMGFHNWNKVYHHKDKIYVEADFNLENNKLTKNKIPIVYFVQNGQAYVQVSYNDWSEFMLISDSTAQFIAILSDTEIATFSNKEYQKLDFSTLNRTPKHTFNMKAQKILSKNDFMKAIKY